MKKKKYLLGNAIALTLALSQTLTAFAAPVSNPSGGETKVALENKYWYQVRMPASINLVLDTETQEYKDDYKFYVSGEASDKFLEVSTDDIVLTNEKGDTATVTNSIAEKGHVYANVKSLQKEEVEVIGRASVNAHNIHSGHYTGNADYKFKLENRTVAFDSLKTKMITIPKNNGGIVYGEKIKLNLNNDNLNIYKVEPHSSNENVARVSVSSEGLWFSVFAQPKGAPGDTAEISSTIYTIDGTKVIKQEIPLATVIINDSADQLPVWTYTVNGNLDEANKAVIPSTSTKWLGMDAVLYDMNLDEKNDLCILSGEQTSSSSNDIVKNAPYYQNDIKEVYFVNAKLSDLMCMFEGCSNLQTINMKGANTSNVTSFGNAFYECSNLVKIPGIESLDTSKVTSLQNTFYNCKFLLNLNLTNWDTSSVTEMSRTFVYCNFDSVGDLNSWDISNVADTSYMFYGCKYLKKLDLGNWNTKNITNSKCMFYDCNTLTSIGDVSNWDTSNIEDMSYMFRSDVKLSDFDASKWVKKDGANVDWAFYKVPGRIPSWYDPKTGK